MSDYPEYVLYSDHCALQAALAEARAISARDERDIIALRADRDRLAAERDLAATRIASLHASLEAVQAELAAAQRLVAEMHAAAVGEIRGPILGVVDDVAALRAELSAARAALENANHLRSALENSVAPLRAALQRIHDENYDLTMLEIMGIAKKALSGTAPSASPANGEG